MRFPHMVGLAMGGQFFIEAWKTDFEPVCI